MSIRNDAAKSVYWTSIESFLLSALSFLSIVVLSRYLTPSEFGSASIAVGLVQLLAVPVESLFHDSIVRQNPTSRDLVDKAFSVTLVLSILLLSVCVFFAPRFLLFVRDADALALLPWIAFTLVGSALGAILTANLRREMNFKVLALRSLIARSVSAVIAILLAVFGFGVWALVWQQITLIFLGSALLWAFSSDRPRFVLRWDGLSSWVSFGVQTTCTNLLAVCGPRLFILLVGWQLGTEIAGKFSLVFRVVDMFRDILAGVVSQLALPIFSRQMNSQSEMNRLFQEGLRYTSYITFPIFVFLACNSSEMTRLLFGEKWIGIELFFSGASILALQFFARIFTGPLYRASGHPGLPNIAIVCQLFFLVIALTIFGEYSSNLSFAIWAGRILVGTPVDMFVLRYATGMGLREQLRPILSPLLASLLMSTIIFGSKFLIPESELLFRIGAGFVLGSFLYIFTLRTLDRSTFDRFLEFCKHAIRTSTR